MKPDERALKDMHILAVDDEAANLLLLQQILELEGYRRVTTTTDPTKVAAMFRAQRPDLVLLDLHMPRINGLQLMDQLRGGDVDAHDVPFLVLTGDVTDETRRRALAAGARDFLIKPLDRVDLVLRVRNLLEVKDLQDRLRRHNARLEAEVAARTRDLDLARAEVLERLALAAEYRDDDTQEHAWRIGRHASLLARGLGLSDRDVQLLGRAALLHDIGKIGISDVILLKPGALTFEEFELVKTHTTVGAEILGGSSSPTMRLAATVALTHHERWDGRGYPSGLKADEIHLAGRIVAVADVFDALSFERPYKPAWPVEEAVAEIVNQSGHQFDPDVVDVFAALDHSKLLTRVVRRARPGRGRTIGAQTGQAVFG